MENKIKNSPTRSCLNKVRFASKGIAEVCIMENFMIKTQAYFCEYCGGWHIGRQNAVAEYFKNRKLSR